MIARKMYGFGNECKFLSIKVERPHGGDLINVLTARKDRFFGRLGRKTRGPREKNDILFWSFSVFGEFFVRQAIDGK